MVVQSQNWSASVTARLQTGENDYGCKERARNPANIGMTSACVLYVATTHDGRRRRQATRRSLAQLAESRRGFQRAIFQVVSGIGSRGACGVLQHPHAQFEK
jgi:hypothetical protein